MADLPGNCVFSDSFLKNFGEMLQYFSSPQVELTPVQEQVIKKQMEYVCTTVNLKKKKKGHMKTST